MINPYSPKLVKIMNDLTDGEKVRLFYELAKHLNNNMEIDENDDKIMKFSDSIANVINAIDNLNK